MRRLGAPLTPGRHTHTHLKPAKAPVPQYRPGRNAQEGEKRRVRVYSRWRPERTAYNVLLGAVAFDNDSHESRDLGHFCGYELEVAKRGEGATGPWVLRSVVRHEGAHAAQPVHNWVA